MSATATLYNAGKLNLINAQMNLGTDTLKVALCTSSYVPNIDTHANLSDITNEVTGTGYTAGGATLASVSTAQDSVNDRAYLTAADTAWANSTLTARYAVLYKSTGSSATSKLIGYIDFGADKSTVADTFYIQWTAAASGGILYLA
jgi:hypothetical protein